MSPSVSHGLWLSGRAWIRKHFLLDEATTDSAICYPVRLRTCSATRSSTRAHCLTESLSRIVRLDRSSYMQLDVNSNGRGEAFGVGAAPQMRSPSSFPEFLFSSPSLSASPSKFD
ncbi:hypothetical protein VNO77_26860 [Canavalia gladiata]|uniref:Uncharacterized protein n=1 Tax=Canavalia gladiata TaxID=3824 RepID=A0AAN9QA02_CANGL